MKWIVGVFIALAALGGWYWFSHRAVSIPTVRLTDQPVALVLNGLNTPTNLNGSCLASFVVAGAGFDDQGHQHYALSMSLKSDPVDAVALAKLLTTSGCDSETKAVVDTITQKLALPKDTPDLLSTTYLTKSRHRLALP